MPQTIAGRTTTPNLISLWNNANRRNLVKDPTEIKGVYGALVINSDGSFTYTPAGNMLYIGKVDQFQYTLNVPAAGATSAATPYVHIDSQGQGLIWDEDDPSQPAIDSIVATPGSATPTMEWVKDSEDQFVSIGATNALGNLFANDGVVPVYAMLQVQSGQSYVVATATGTDIVGQYGKLTVYGDGSYKYEPTSALLLQTRRQQDLQRKRNGCFRSLCRYGWNQHPGHRRTGYNDTFYATNSRHVYNGAGGSGA